MSSPPRTSSGIMYSEEHAKAFAFADKKLAKSKYKTNVETKLEPYKFTHVTTDMDKFIQPFNQQIALLFSLYLKYQYQFNETFKNYSTDPCPWLSEKVIKKLDKVIKIAYCISSLTLDEIHNVKKQCFASSSIEQIIIHTRKEAYISQTLCLITEVYHKVRGRWVLKSEDSKDKFVAEPNFSPNGKYAGLFYEKGSLQREWRHLYNNTAYQLDKAITDKVFIKARNPTFLDWYKPEHKKSDFITNPNSILKKKLVKQSSLKTAVQR